MQSKEDYLISENEKARIIYEKMLAFEMDQMQRANIQKRIGDNCLKAIRQLNDPSGCERAIAAYEEALLVFTPDDYPIPYAKIMSGMGFAYAVRADYADRAKNLKQAIFCWKEALNFYFQDAATDDHASLQNELGNAYRKLAELESRQENGKKAIEACMVALRVSNLKDSPLQFAAAKANLGSSYLTLAQSANEQDHAKSCKEAISAYQQAIYVYSRLQSPMQCAAMKNNLAIAYLSLSETENKAGNCRLALAACREALVHRTEKDHPLAYAASQNNLGNAYLALAEEEMANEGKSTKAVEEEKVDGAANANEREDGAETEEAEGGGLLENCYLAMEAYCNALRVYFPDVSPRLYAIAQNNLANVYLTLAQKVDKTENCMKAIIAAQKALDIFSQKDSPEDYGEAKGSLWQAYLTLADIEYRAENCALALQACEERLHSYRVWAAHPLQIASCCRDLAMTAILLADNEISLEAKAEDCKKAISAGKEALQICEVSSYPEEYAEAQFLLWAAYSALAEVQDSRENRRRAIEACLEAVRVYEGTNPSEHADALKNLGCSYINLAEAEDKEDNCQKAIEAFKRGMQYYTLEAAPKEHADILKDLAFAYVTLSDVSNKEACSKKAFKAYKKAFRIYQTLAEELERNGNPGVSEMKEIEQKCLLSMQSCKAMMKAGRKAGSSAALLQDKP